VTAGRGSGRARRSRCLDAEERSGAPSTGGEDESSGQFDRKPTRRRRADCRITRTASRDQRCTIRKATVSISSAPPRHLVPFLTAVAVIAALCGAVPAEAASRDRDHDGMPNRWEVRHDLDPDRANASADPDGDGLANLAEYRHGGDPQREDTDRDGQDDGDEVGDDDRSTSVDDPDGDDDGVRDGDEDADHDGVANEDEDDALEACARDDDDRDGDHVADEDENDFGSSARDRDSDDDGVLDGDEDADDDGQSNEDDDDHAEDRCGRHHGEDDDDELGPIVSFDDETGQLVIDPTRTDVDLAVLVTPDTRIEWDTSGHDSDDPAARRGGGDDATVADLVPGTVVAEIKLDDDRTSLEEVELERP
jgi:hypothetical protein